MDSSAVPLGTAESGPAPAGSGPSSLRWWNSPATLRLLRIALLAGFAFFGLHSLFNLIDGDVQVYFKAVDALRQGLLPYRDHVFEYPPYVLAIFALPALGRDYIDFRWLFAAELLAVDLALKAWLLAWGAKRWKDVRSLVPCLAFGATGVALDYLYLKRFDLVPAALVVAALAALAAGRQRSSGALLAAGVGVKVFPIVLLPMCFVAARRQGRAGRFLAGFALGLAPLALLALWLPWWRFAAFQGGRGLQAESVVASALYFLHFFGLDAPWRAVKLWAEVGGPAARALLPWAKLAFVALSLGSGLLAARYVQRARELDLTRLSAAAFFAVAGFVVPNTVLSPQFLIWMAVPLAVALPVVPLEAALMFGAALLLTPTYYPSPAYNFGGLHFWGALALLLRNLALVGCYAAVARWMWPRGVEVAAPEAPASAEKAVSQ